MSQHLSNIKLRAWTSSQGSRSPCDWDDPAADCYAIFGASAQYAGDPLEFADKQMAERVAYSLAREFEAGKRAAKAELKAWLA